MKTNAIKLMGVAGFVALGLSSCALVPDGEPKKGCTDPQAVNYDISATQDNGGCVTIQQKQYSMFYKYTATWCGPCGDWGGPAFVEVVDNTPGQILAFTIQTNDDFTTPANDEIFDAFSAKWPYGGTPNFQCNNASLGTGYSGAYTEIATTNANAPVAGVGIHTTVGAGSNAGKLNVNAYVKFFAGANGNYHLGLYILHKNIVKSQNTGSGMVPTYEHHHVMMSHITPVFGDLIASGQISAGSVFHLGYVFPYTDIPDLSTSQYEVVGILWKSDGAGGFDLVNVTPNT